MVDIVITDARPAMPDVLDELAIDAGADGMRIVAFVIERWVDGTQRFDGPAERLLIASIGDDVVGLGGLTACPDVEGALRMRRFYVARSWRRHGVAGALASALVEAARGHTEMVTCNAQASAAAGPFWESRGFVSTEIAGVTHVLHLGAKPVG